MGAGTIDAIAVGMPGVWLLVAAVVGVATVLAILVVRRVRPASRTEGALGPVVP